MHGDLRLVMKKGFTLIELMVVVAMIMILIGALSVSVAQARTRARIAKATQETRELTNAILAYEQYAPNHSLESVATGGGWTECNEGSIKMVLGGMQGDNGEQIPVLFNASLTGGRMLDPWGRPYELMIEKTSTLSGGGDSEQRTTRFVTAPYLPNFFRLTDKERGM